MKNILAPFGPATSNQYAQAAGGVLSAGLGALGQFGQGLGQAGQGYMQGLGQQGNAYAGAFNGYAGGIAGLGQSASQGLGYYGQGLTGLGNAQASGFGSFAGGLGQLGQSAAQGLGYLGQGLTGLGNAQAGAYGAYSQGLGGVANSIGQERSNFYNSNSVAEAARQAALGNIGTASLSAYGGAANNAMSAWAQNQLAYNQALAQLGTANQTGLSQLGQSRNTALGNLGGAYGDLGGKLGAASVLGNLNFNMSDGTGGSGFQATGPDGEIASGSYGGGGGFNASGSRVSDTSQLRDISAPAYGGLSGLQSNLMASDISDSMNRNYTDGMDRLDTQHYSSRGMPSQMLGQTLSGLLSLGRDAYGQVRGGMDQFYATQNDPRNRGDYSGILAQLGQGYGATRDDLNLSRGLLASQSRDLGSRLDGYGRDMGRAYGTMRSDLNASRGDLRTAYGDTASRLDRYSDQMKEGFGTANKNIGGVLESLHSGFGKVAESMKGMSGEALSSLFPDEEQTGASERRRRLADTIFNYRLKGYAGPGTHLDRLAQEMGVTL